MTTDDENGKVKRCKNTKGPGGEGQDDANAAKMMRTQRDKRTIKKESERYGKK